MVSPFYISQYVTDEIKTNPNATITYICNLISEIINIIIKNGCQGVLFFSSYNYGMNDIQI